MPPFKKTLEKSMKQVNEQLTPKQALLRIQKLIGDAKIDWTETPRDPPTLLALLAGVQVLADQGLQNDSSSD
jgi:hypothetical protein